LPPMPITPGLPFKKKLLSRLNYNLLSPLYGRYQRFVQIQKSRACAKEFGLDFPDYKMLQEHKKSDTVFVLGSGPSINEINSERWEQIRNHDTVGMNFWIIHEHVPTFYFIEPINPQQRPDLDSGYRKILAQRFHDYEKVPKFVSDLHFAHTPDFIRRLRDVWPHALYRIRSYMAVGRTEREMAMSLQSAEKQKIFDASDGKIEELFKYSLSLSIVLNFCIIMGYRKIVLCGVELNSLNYFYEDPNRYPDFSGFRKNIHREGKLTLLNYLFQSEFAIPFDKVIYAFQEQIIKKRNIFLAVESRASALYPVLPLFKE